VTSRAGKDLVSCLVSGLLTIGPRFGGAIDDAARYFQDATERVRAKVFKKYSHARWATKSLERMGLTFFFWEGGRMFQRLMTHTLFCLSVGGLGSCKGAPLRLMGPCDSWTLSICGRTHVRVHRLRPSAAKMRTAPTVLRQWDGVFGGCCCCVAGRLELEAEGLEAEGVHEGLEQVGYPHTSVCSAKRCILHPVRAASGGPGVSRVAFPKRSV
jgi:hypothetical protein